jgi:hypothetical protein
VIATGRSRRGGVALHGALMLAAMILLAALSTVTGRIQANNGQGYDGEDYADMTVRAWHEGTANTALRPLIILANRPALWLTGDVVKAFRVMNYVYVALLALGLSLLMDRYDAPPHVQAFVVIHVFSCWAFAKMFAYYPVLVDVGALAIITIAAWTVVRGGLAWAAAACVLAVLSREFGIAVVAFGVHHGLRTGRSWWRVALAYAPAAAVYFWWRSEVAARFARYDQLVTIPKLIDNLALWRDPTFAAFFLYFLLTVVGGVSMFVLARAGSTAAWLRREPEWATFAAAVLIPSVAGNADMWRYLAFLLPAFVVLFVVCAREFEHPRVQLILAALLLATGVITQRPMQLIDVPAYFRDWFPYYQLRGIAPSEAALPVWPVWGWRMLTAAALFWLMTVPAAAPAARSVVVEEQVA